MTEDDVPAETVGEQELDSGSQEESFTTWSKTSKQNL